MAHLRSLRSDPIVALRERGFLVYLIGSLIANTGNQMRAVAVSWEVYERTRQPLSLGLIGLAMAMPVLLLALPAGAAADRYSRRWMVILGQTGLALSGLGLAWVSATGAPVVWIYVMLLATGTFRALGWPAATAMVVGLVPKQSFPNAAMWRSITIQLAATLGPLFAGLLLAWVHPRVVYVIDALACFTLVGCMFFVRPKRQPPTNEPHSWHNVIEGVRYLYRQPILFSTMVLDMIAVLFGGVTALLPMFAADILHVGPTGYGWLRAMPSIGAICMGIALAIRRPMRRSGRALLIAVSIFGIAAIAFGLSKSFPVSLVALFIMGASDNISVVVRATVLQLLTPDSMRGRVSAVSIIFIGTSNEIGELESGLVAQLIGPIWTVLGGGVLTLVTVAAAARIWPELVKLGPLEALEPPKEGQGNVGEERRRSSGLRPETSL